MAIVDTLKVFIHSGFHHLASEEPILSEYDDLSHLSDISMSFQ